MEELEGAPCVRRSKIIEQNGNSWSIIHQINAFIIFISICWVFRIAIYFHSCISKRTKSWVGIIFLKLFPNLFESVFESGENSCDIFHFDSLSFSYL